MPTKDYMTTNRYEQRHLMRGISVSVSKRIVTIIIRKAKASK